MHKEIFTMKTIRSFVLLAATTFMVTLSAAIGSSADRSYVVTYAGTESVAEYYSSITSSMEGDTLLQALHTLNNQKRKKLVTYAGLRQAASVIDADPDGSGKIVGFYDNQLVGPSWDSGKTWNREHVWPNARGGNLVEDDAHMTRPASTQTNSDRGSKGYSTKSYDPGQFVSYYRGVASRIIFYAAIADTNLKIIDDPLNYDGKTPANSMGALSDMLKWNLEYLPSDTSFTGQDDLARRTELNRNEQIQKSSVGQGNRNPFIDHPEYACRIWGNTNAQTREICKVNPSGTGGSGQTDPTSGTNAELEKIQLSIKEKKIAIGEEFSISAQYVPENAENKPDYTMYSTDTSVAKIENNVVTGLANGVCEIVVATDDLQYVDRCKVTVGTGKADSSGNHAGCGGTVTITSVLLSTISLLGIGLLLIRKYKR